MSSEGDRRQFKCRKDYKTVVGQFGPLMKKIDSWKRSQKTHKRSPVLEVEKNVPSEQLNGEDLAETIRKILRALDGCSSTSTDGGVAHKKPETCS